MKKMPEIGHYHAQPGGVQRTTPELLSARLPISLASAADSESITYKDYFQIIEQFIFANWDAFLIAAQSQGNVRAIDRIDIISEKHGSDYHPARIQGPDFSFVANVATTERGKSRLAGEFQILRHINSNFDENFLPRVFLSGNQLIEDGREFPLFIGEWFEDFHEFHLSKTPNGILPVIWDMQRGTWALDPNSARELFAEAAFIPTYYYNFDTFEEIFPWHHAAGDFIVKRAKEGLQVKLITVRQYAPRIFFPEQSPDNRFQALSAFFANLTLRMRLDRLDGTGEIVWAGDFALEGAFRGFLNALKQKDPDPLTGKLPDELFLEIVGSLSLTELAELFQTAVESFNPDAPDMPIIEQNLPDHIFGIYRLINSYQK